MHRIASLPGDYPSDGFSLVEQPEASVLFLTSASTDIVTLASAIEEPTHQKWNGKIRALPLANIEHPAQIDHYLASTANQSNLILVRLLGGRGHWNYGFEQLNLWVNKSSTRKLIIVSGTSENEKDLNSLSNISPEIV